MPNLLFFAVNVPLEDRSGGQIATWRLLESYARLGTVDVLALASPDARPHDDLESLARRVSVVPIPHFHHAESRTRSAALFLRSQFTRQPFRIAKFENRDAGQILRSWSESTDYAVAHFDHLSAAPYRALLPGVPAILANHNVEGQLAARLAQHQRNPLVRWLLDVDSRRTIASEASLLDRFDHTLVLSEHDRMALLALRPELAERLSVWPVPVSLGQFVEADRNRPFTVLVLGSLRSMGRLHGLRWLLENVWPGVRNRLKQARLEVVGAEPPADISSQHGNDGVYVHGYVDDLEPILARSDLCAIPLFIGGGIRIKVMELVCRGIPCMGTAVALQGLDWLQSGQQVDSAAEWITALVAAAGRIDALKARARRDAIELATRNSTEAATSHLARVLRDLDPTLRDLAA
jgi:glycosyl transferase family 1